MKEWQAGEENNIYRRRRTNKPLFYQSKLPNSCTYFGISIFHVLFVIDIDTSSLTHVYFIDKETMTTTMSIIQHANLTYLTTSSSNIPSISTTKRDLALELQTLTAGYHISTRTTYRKEHTAEQRNQDQGKLTITTGNFFSFQVFQNPNTS